jgi:HK97 family phage portal protein
VDHRRAHRHRGRGLGRAEGGAVILDFLFSASAEHQKILTSEDLARALGGGSSTGAGVHVTPERAMRLATVYTCVRILAESVGQLPLHLYKETGREKVKAVDHPLYGLLHDAPNEYQTAQEWLEYQIACLALHGNGYSHINRSRRRVLELLPFPPGTITPQYDRATGVLRYRFQGATGVEYLDSSEVLHIKLFGSLDPICGASPIRYAREAVGLAIAAEQHGANLFGNGAQPGGILETDKALNKQARDNLQQTWDARHGGIGNAYKTAVLEDGLKWKSMAMPMVDAQWLESRKFQKGDIFGIFRVPPHLGADLERATFSNIEHSSLDFVVHTLMPYLTRIEQRIKLQLLAPEERSTMFAKFNVAALLRGDMTAKGEYYTRQVQNGVLSPNEIREYEDLNPREGGDVYLTPSNMLIDGKAPPSSKPAPPPDPAPAK